MLLEQVEEEFGAGWQSELARRTGLHQTTISKLRAEQRGKELRDDTLAKLARGLKIPRSFFSDRSLGRSPDYRDFINARETERTEQGRAIVRAWLESEEGALVTADQAERLLSMDWGGVDVTPRMVRVLWLELDAEDRGRRIRPAAEDQAPTDLGDKRRIT